MELTPLRYFVTIARHGHLTRAARELGVTQPALSAMLRKLERELGADLMDRTARGVELTAAGRAFLEHAHDAVRRAEQGIAAVRQVIGLESGSIRVGGGATATTYLLPRVVGAVRRAHPGLRFFVREAGSRHVAAAVVSGELDVGIVTLPLARQEQADLLVIPFVNDELRLILPPRHPLAGRKHFKWTDLDDQPIVAFEAGSAVRGVIDQASAAAGVVLTVVMELRSIESIKQMVAAGIGVGFVSRFAIPPGTGLPCREGGLIRKLAIVRRADRVPSPAAALFESQMLALGNRRTGPASEDANVE